MQTMIVCRNVCDLFANESQTERVSQALLGQLVQRTAEFPGHFRVQTGDRYHGHILKHAVTSAAACWSAGKQKQVKVLFAPVRAQPRLTADVVTTLVLSTTVSVGGTCRGHTGIIFPDGTRGYVRSEHLGKVVKPRSRALDERLIASTATKAVAVAKRLAGTPYLWGGTTPYGIDCSGLVQLSYKMAGLELLRDARLQIADKRFAIVAEGESFDKANLQCGDLVFFGNVTADGITRVTHVGMISSDGRMVHSAGGYGVVIESRLHHRLATSYLGARRLKVGAYSDIALA